MSAICRVLTVLICHLFCHLTSTVCIMSPVVCMRNLWLKELKSFAGTQREIEPIENSLSIMGIICFHVPVLEKNMMGSM